MKPMLRRLLLAAAAMAVLAACAPPKKDPTLTPPSASPTQPAASPTARPAATPTPSTEAAAPAGERPALPAPTLFDISWDDRAPFEAGLIAAEQTTLAEQPGASIYHMDLVFSDDLTAVKGREELRYTNTEEQPLDKLTFRLFPNLAGGASKVSNLTVNGAAAEPAYLLEDSVMEVPLSLPLQPGEQVVVAMDFDVTVPTAPGGNYGTFAYTDGILALAHFYPMVAVYDQTGWNAEIAPRIGDVVYADAGYYLVRADLPVGQILVTSGIEVAREEKDGRQTVTLAAGPVRDFYLVASDRYDALTDKVGETTIRTFAPKEVEAENAAVLDFASAAVKSFAKLAGDYPFTELDVVATPTLAGGVEYPGIVVVALSLYDTANDYLQVVTAHEVGHQWFYSTVGNDQVDEPWLDEALTQYLTLLYFRDSYGQGGYDGFRGYLDERWRSVEDQDMPIGLPVAAYDEDEYSAIVYGKGPLFFEALAEEMGDEAFAAFLKDYYQTFKHRNASGVDLKAAAEAQCGCDLDRLFAEWVEGER